MKITINDKSIFTAALHLAEDGEYFEALTMFNRVDSYESMLNQIGCLSELGDFGYAVELFGRILARYGLTHNCYADLCLLGKSTEMVASCVSVTLEKNFTERDDKRASAQADLLANYGRFGDDDMDDLDALDDEADIPPAFEPSYESLRESQEKKSRFFDIKSPDYANGVRYEMEKAFFNGDFAKGMELQKLFMTLDTDDAATLELQMVFSFASKNWDDAVKFADKLASNPNASGHGLVVAIDVLYRADKLTSVPQALSRVVELTDDLRDDDLMNMLTVAANTVGYGEIALALCDALYSHSLDVGCAALRLCARVYFNCGERELAREAVLLLLRAVPWDSIGKLMLDYFESGFLPLDNPRGSQNVERHYDVPQQLAAMARNRLQGASKDVLREEDYVCLDCLFKDYTGCVVKNDMDGVVRRAEALEVLINSLTPADMDSYVKFVKEQFCDFLSDTAVNNNYLYKLLTLGYRERIVINNMRRFYILDLSKVNSTDDRFLRVLGLCGTVRRVDFRKMAKAYKTLVETLGLTADELSKTRQVAYAMLAATYNTFAGSADSRYFAEGDDEMYSRYLAELAKKQN